MATTRTNGRGLSMGLSLAAGGPPGIRADTQPDSVLLISSRPAWPSVGDAGELLAGALELAGPLAGPAEGTGGLAAEVSGRGSAGEVDVLAPVHPPRVGPVGVAREVPGQVPEEPVHDLRLAAVAPQRVEPVAEPAGPPPGEIVGVAGEPAVDVLGLAVHAQRGVEVIDVELGPLAVAPDLVRRRAVGAVVGALHRMPDLVRGQLPGQGDALVPALQPAVADIVVVVDRADVVARLAAAVPPGVVDGVDARVGTERVAVGGLGVLPGRVDEPGQPRDLGAAHVGVGVDRAVLVVMVEPEQLAVVEPVLLPGGRRVSQLS